VTKALVNHTPSPHDDLEAAEPPGSLAELEQREGRSRGLPAWLLSLALHACILIALSTLVRVTYRGASLEPARGGGIVLASDTEGTAEYFGPDDQAIQSAKSSTSSASAADQTLPSEQELPLDLAGMFPDASAELSGSDWGDALPSADGFAADQPASGGKIGGNQTRTSIFGAEGTGSKFVYVFDRSASMDGYQGRPLAAAKSELIASLQDLEQIHQFQIIFYNERPSVFNPARPDPPRMLYGDSATKRLAQNYIRGIVASGGTQHMEALKMAINMRPDVVFFLTDAAEPQLSPSQLDEIRRRNSRFGVTINAIEFGAGPSQSSLNFLVRLAQQNGGHHVYVDVTRLPFSR
jgi:hypothetical protein